MIFKCIWIPSVLIVVIAISTGYTQNSIIMQTTKDVPIHHGYKIKYSFKDNHYLDFEILPNPNLNDWLALTIEKGTNGTNKLSLHTYSGKDLENVETDDSHLDVGNCKQIRTFVEIETIFLIPIVCDKHTQQVDVIIVDPTALTLTKLITLPHSAVADAQFWTNIHTQELNLVVLSRVKSVNNVSSFLSHYVFNSENATFTKVSEISLINALSATVFDIDDKTYIAISNYRSSDDKFVNSEIFVQNMKYGGKLFKYQTLRSKGTISLTYFCYIGQSKTEHFLLTADNGLLKANSQRLKAAQHENSFEESIIFKWENNYFIPFQTLLVRVPSPWIMVPGSNDGLVLLTWSYLDGIISYQYDGWRFRRTAIHQEDIVNLDSPNFAFLKPVSIAGETVFTIFTSKNRAKRKHFFVPIFKDNTKMRMTYDEKMDWCKNTFLELRLAWNEFSSHYQYLKELDLNNNTAPKDKITAIFDLILGYNSRRKLINSNLEIMSLQGSTPYETYLFRSSNPRQCTISNPKQIELMNITKIIPLENSIIGIKEPNTIVYYPFLKKKIQDLSTVMELYYLRNVEKVIQFQLIEMCNRKGIYIQGLSNGKLFGKVYKIEENIKLEFFIQLKVSKQSYSSVKGYCSRQFGDCFIISPTQNEGICTIQCGYHVVKHFFCKGGSYHDHSINWNEHTTIGIHSNNTIYKIDRQGLSNNKIENLKTEDKASQILMKSTDQQIYFAIILPEEIQICQLDMTSDKPMGCTKLDIIPTNSTTIQLASVKKKICVFVMINQRIYIHIVKADYTMILDLEEKLKFPNIKPFSVSKSNFISSSTDSKTTVIEYEMCHP